jgi:hypothetical protein
MPPFKLTLFAVREAARKAYAEGELGFQKGEKHCAYLGETTGAPCAVGAALPLELRKMIAAAKGNSENIGTLITKGFVTVPFEDRTAIQRIQERHDDILRNRYSSLEAMERKPESELVRAFEYAIGIPA